MDESTQVTHIRPDSDSFCPQSGLRGSADWLGWAVRLFVCFSHPPSLVFFAFVGGMADGLAFGSELTSKTEHGTISV